MQVKSSSRSRRAMRISQRFAIVSCILVAIAIALDWRRSFGGYGCWRMDMTWPSTTVEAKSQDGYLEVSFRVPARPPIRQLTDDEQRRLNDILSRSISYTYAQQRRFFSSYPTMFPFTFHSYRDSPWQQMTGGPLEICDPNAPFVNRALSEHWFVLVCISMLLALLLSPKLIRWLMTREHYDGCRICGYDLRASPTRCPECGTATLSTLLNRRQDALQINLEDGQIAFHMSQS